MYAVPPRCGHSTGDVYKRQEYIIDQGYYNNKYRVPSKEFRDFQAFQRREVAKLAKAVSYTHLDVYKRQHYRGNIQKKQALILG